jgi:hypothetical protein
MGEIVLRDDLLTPAHKKTLEFSGLHPSRLIRELPEIIKDILKIESADFFEDEFKWDVSGDPIEFYVVWRARQPDLDKWSTIWLKFTLHGFQNKKDKIGKAKLTITGYLETKFPYNNFLHKSLLRLYNYMFYTQQRRKY